MADDIAHQRRPVTTGSPPEKPATSGMSVRVPHLDRLLTPGGSWSEFAVRAAATYAALALAIWLSAHVRAAPALRGVALFVHMSSLVLGFGAVLAADYFLLLWLLGLIPFTDTMSVTGRMHLLVWTGLAGLIVSGTLLRPDLSSGLTQLKLALVFVLTLNGAHLPILARRMTDSAGSPCPRLLAWGAAAAATSQVCWWGAIWIGFWNTNHRL
jgi:hypothetical protein